MSNRFLPDGTPIPEEEVQIYKLEKQRSKEATRLKNCTNSLLWLGNALQLPRDFDLKKLIYQCTLSPNELYLEPRFVKKAKIGSRVIITPKDELMIVQRRISKLLQSSFTRHQNSFGFMGGSCLEVAKKHAVMQSTLKFDIKDAFFQVSWTQIRTRIRSWSLGVLPGFSRILAYWIARLCTYQADTDYLKHIAPKNWFLPQGGPSSPICFDLCCYGLDKNLQKLAKRVGGRVSRYADNYFFSINTSTFSPKLERMIFGEVNQVGFPVHKIKKIKQGELCKILGYNVQNESIRNSRNFLRKLRGALYVLRTKLERNLEWYSDYEKVKGMMGVSYNIPNNLSEAFQYCEDKILILTQN